MDQSNNIGQLALALSKAQGLMNGAAKTSDNPFFKSKYADLHECIEAAKEPLAKNELAVVQTTDTDEKGIWVYTTLVHSSGEWVRGRILMRPKKDDDQSTGSSITYGRRYGYAAIIGLAQKDDDGNESCATAEKTEQPKPSAKTPDKASPAGNKIIDQWLEWIDRFTDATLDQFLAQWEEHGKKAMAKMPEDHQKKMQIAKSEMEKHLMEKKA